MTVDVAFTVKTARFDENYHPSGDTRATTNFANLARGESRRENLRNVLRMIDQRCNALASWDNSESDRYSVCLEIVSVFMALGGDGAGFPVIEMLKTSIWDKKRDTRIAGILGNNFSSYIRDYDFSIALPEYNKGGVNHGVPEGFGDLHGQIFKAFIKTDAYAEHAAKPPVICLSVSHDKAYKRLDNRHPVLGVEYRAEQTSMTEAYFRKMGMQARYFMPDDSRAPLAFYCSGDLLNDYTPLELIATISTMESFQKIYRPEIYNANARAGQSFQPSLTGSDHSLTKIAYDREERRHLGVAQGRYAEENFLTPYRDFLGDWCARHNR